MESLVNSLSSLLLLPMRPPYFIVLLVQRLLREPSVYIYIYIYTKYKAAARPGPEAHGHPALPSCLVQGLSLCTQQMAPAMQPYIHCQPEPSILLQFIIYYLGCTFPCPKHYSDSDSDSDCIVCTCPGLKVPQASEAYGTRILKEQCAPHPPKLAKSCRTN